MSQKTYTVKGMSCGGCERTVSLAVSKVPGVTEVKASAPANSVLVLFSGDPVDAGLIKTAVEKCGYQFIA